MSDLRELYQEIIIDHGRKPRNFGVLPEATHHKEGFNPLCGDKIILHVKENNGVVDNLSFEGCGCAISMASASLMTEILKGKTLDDINELFEIFHQVITEGNNLEASKEKLGKLAV